MYVPRGQAALVSRHVLRGLQVPQRRTTGERAVLRTTLATSVFEWGAAACARLRVRVISGRVNPGVAAETHQVLRLSSGLNRRAPTTFLPTGARVGADLRPTSFVRSVSFDQWEER